jgi:predicted MFS family arabinose efflux permease
MKRVLRLPTYRRLLAAYSFNELAWSVGALALAVLIYRRTGSVLGSTAFFLVSLVIPAFVSPFLVARLDQRAPRSILPLLYAVEGVLFGVLALMTAHFSLAAVLALALVDGIVALAARALARSATVGVLKPEGLLHEGNAVTNAAFSVCFMAGPAIGGLVVAAGGTVAALLANCALFTVIALILATAHGLPGAVPEPEPSRGRLRAAIEHVRRDRPQRWLLTLQAAGMIAFTISIPVEVVLAEHTLHAGAGGYGAMLSTWGVGAVLGSAAYARWRRRSARLLMATSGIALAVGFGLMAAAPAIGVALAGTTLGGAGNGVQSVAARTALQEYTPEKWMAMVMSLNESVSQAAPGVGILLGGLLAAWGNPRIALAVAGVGSLAFAVAVWIVLRPSAMPPPPVETDVVRARPRDPQPIVPAATASSETLV